MRAAPTQSPIEISSRMSGPRMPCKVRVPQTVHERRNPDRQDGERCEQRPLLSRTRFGFHGEEAYHPERCRNTSLQKLVLLLLKPWKSPPRAAHPSEGGMRSSRWLSFCSPSGKTYYHSLTRSRHQKDHISRYSSSLCRRSFYAFNFRSQDLCSIFGF